MKVLIDRLKKARHNKRIGGIIHAVQFEKIENEVIEKVKNINIEIEKPEYLHANNIISWYRDNEEYLRNINIL